MAYIKILSASESSIRVQVAGLQTGYESSDRVCTWYLDGQKKGTSKLGANVSAGGSYTFTALTPGTSYDISASITAPSWDYTVDLDTITAETDEPQRPLVEPWSWTSSNGSASAAQTRRAYSAVTGGGSLGDFSYLVWNDMADKLMEILEAIGDGWNTTYATYAETKMSSGDKVLTAKRFNALRQNIGRHVATGISATSKGDPVRGAYFITLTDRMNDMI